MVKRGRYLFDKVKPTLSFLSKCLCILPYSMRYKLFEHYRMTKGIKGIALRYILLKTLCKACGNNVAIESSVYLLNPARLSLGNNVSINPMCYIEAAGEISIGNDVSIAHGVTVMSTSHQYTNLEIPIKDQGISYEKVVIGSNVWIGAKATILSGTTIRSGVIVGANAVVTKDVPENTIVGGVPARLIKSRVNA